MSNTSPAESQPGATEQAPRIWATTLMFAITFLAALVAVPWYGLTHGFSTGAWVLFVVFLYANGMSITGGYHRLWAHKTYDAHWSLKLIYLIFGTMALQNSVFAWASGHRTHHLNVDDVDQDP
jgi:stearoyl-CoA desaturase (delta-9 desaturase)